MTQTIPVSAINDPAWNSRLRFMDDKELPGLAESIKARGLLQPIVVDYVGEMNGAGQILADGQNPNDKTIPRYELVAGSRRLAAVKLAGLDTIEATVRTYTAPSDKVVDNIIENLQRVDLSSFEVARAYSALRESGLKLKDVREHTGASIQTISTLVTAYNGVPDVIKQEWRKENPVCTREFLAVLVAIKDPDAQIAKFKEQSQRLKEYNDAGGAKAGKVKPTAKPKKNFIVKGEVYKRLAEACKKVKGDRVSKEMLIGVLDYAVGKVESVDGLIEVEETKEQKEANKIAAKGNKKGK